MEKQHEPTPPASKECPECGHTFKGNGWDGIDAHWKAKHEDVMLYDEAWPKIQAGTYRRTEPLQTCMDLPSAKNTADQRQ